MHAARLLAVALLGWTLGSVAHAQNFDAVQIETIPLGGNVTMLVGRGGNLAFSSGEDGVFLVDDQYAPLTDKILAAIHVVSSDPVRFVVNTHWHGDHTGGNENFGKRGAILVAHENVRSRMSRDQFMKAFNRNVPASPAGALPVVTFADGVTFHWNGDTISVAHVPAAHTDGDSIIRFEVANVLHMGDVFFNNRYPFIDVQSGGTIGGLIAGAERGIGLANGATQVVPGHGPLTDRDGLQRYRDMLVDVRERVLAHKRAGRSVEEAIAAKPTAQYDALWGGGFVKPDAFVRVVYASLSD